MKLTVFSAVLTCSPYTVGVLRGTGKQFLGTVANVCAYNGVGLRMAYLVCFRLHFGVDGLMMGIASGSLVQLIVLLTLIFDLQLSHCAQRRGVSAAKCG